MRLGLSQKLALGMGGLLALVGSACVIGLVVMARTGQATDRLLDTTIAEARFAEAGELALLNARRGEKHFLLRKDPAYIAKVSDSVGRLKESLSSVVGVSADAGRVAAAERGLASADRYLESIEALAAAYEERGLDHESGREGELRRAVHALETDLKEVERDDLRVLMLMARRHEKDYLLRGDEKYLAQVEQRLGEFVVATGDVEQATRDRWNGLWQTYAGALRALVDAEKRIAERSETARAAAHEIEGIVGEISEGAMAGVGPAREELSDTRSRARSMLLGVLGFGVLFAAGVAWLTIRSVVGSIRPVVARAGEIASGDLTGEPLDVLTSDELGRLTLAINEMSGALAGLVREIGSAASDVESMSGEVAAGSLESAEQAREQEAQAAQVSAAVTEMSASIEEVAGQSTSVAESASDAGRNASEGERVVGETVSVIRGLAERIETLGGVMNRLGDRSEQIGSIIGVINDIADQTNLLALNAAIEAARAGEHGRGFAVVADEVRKLADRTTEATAQVTESIRSIQEDTRSAVGEMEESRSRIGEGVSAAERAGGSLGAITRSSGAVAGMVQSIAAATQQQATAAEEISRTLDAIRASNEQSAAGAAMSAQAATSLSDRAARLRSLVGSFRVS